MRVISGSARGRPLKGPPSQATRPMADKIKGALYTSLASLRVEPVRVLDLYAGTGSIGIEALSRGASSAVFVDQGRDPCNVIRQNLQTTGFADVATVVTTPVTSYITGDHGAFDFIILDPPYAADDILDVLQAVEQSSLVADKTIVVLGHWPRLDLPERIGRLERLRHRCHGDSCFSIFDLVDAAPPATTPSDEEDSA